jgi:hypothetical protein
MCSCRCVRHRRETGSTRHRGKGVATNGFQVDRQRMRVCEPQAGSHRSESCGAAKGGTSFDVAVAASIWHRQLPEVNGERTCKVLQ